jgi:hypothetical protein
LPVTADAQGSVTIVQETQTLGAICLNLMQDDGSLVNVNPMLVTIDRMNNIQNGTQLAAVQVTDEQGNTTPLVPAGTPSGNTDAVAQGIAQFVKTSTTLPQNGTSANGAQSRLLRAAPCRGPSMPPREACGASNSTMATFPTSKDRSRWRRRGWP